MTRLRPYILAIAFVLLATVARVLLDPWLGDRYPLATYYVALLAAAIHCHARAAIFSLILGAITGGWFFLAASPQLSRVEVLGVVLYLVIGAMIVYVAARSRRAVEAARAQSAEVARREEALAREIATRKEVEAEVRRLNNALQRNVKELALVLEQSPVGIAFARDPQCQRVSTNSAFRDLMLGPDAGTSVADEEDLDSLSPRLLKTGRDLAPDDHPMRRCIVTGEAILGEELEIRPSDRAAAVVLFNVAPIVEEGRVQGCVASVVDITERKHAEEARLASEARERERYRELEAIMEAVPAAVFIAEDPQCQSMRTNHAGYQMLRLPRGTNPSKSATDAPAADAFRVLHDNVELPPHQLPVQRAAHGAEIKNYEEDIVFPDGTVSHWLGNAVPLRDDFGNPRGAVAAFVDITERKQAEKALRESEQLFRGVAEGMPHMVWQTDADGMNQYQNSVWYDYIGEGPGDSLGEDRMRFYHPEDRERVAAEWHKSVASKGEHPYDVEARIRRHDGAYRWFRVKGAPLRNGAGEVVKWVGTCTDIEDQKRAVEALREADRRKDEFLATLGHELRNPLAPIRNAIEIIRKNLSDERRRAWALEIIDRQLHQLSRIIDDLLELARVASGRVGLKKEMAPLRDIVTRAVETARPLIQNKGQRLRVELPPTPIMLNADPARLVQVLSNLMNNAVKHTPRDGTILLAASERNGRLELRVRDSGAGIDPKQLPRLFDMFRRAPGSSEDGGLGIGLAFAKRMIELHGGYISAYSEGIGKGSEFRIELPLEEIRQPVMPAASSDSPRGELQSKRVVVVDDNHDTADSMAELLKMHGHHVLCLYDGERAVQRSLDFQPDVVLLDIGLPGADGYEVARRFRANPVLHHVPLVALTGHGQDADKQKARESGFDFHFTKPLDPKALIDFVDACAVQRVIDINRESKDDERTRLM